ncbi:beta-glucosidase [Orenia metallireducens]|uniref:Beta-glucosidase n=1 Tax=Orenia metallireducens TaxID=1413210 RepID=A0A285HHJ9_9FIRM|nr:glycoside hydrolase family 3 N-terminal domain-containing protein [Orenia metallireducens]PRX27189.1 beta-glucosidase [Orenia metallireducens]SNY35230.1 beta-glucosidase [Orenia metallireducens]
MFNIFKISLVLLLVFSIFILNEERALAEAQLTDEESIDRVVAEMSLEEKVSILVGPGMSGESLVGLTDAGVPGAAGNINGVPRFGIPAIVLADGPAGLRINSTREGTEETFYATAFPVATAIASSWNTDLAKEVGDAVGEEIKEYGVDIWLAPALNIHRNPLTGRNFEYYSEDPLISGKMAAAVVNGVEDNGVGTTIKHFVANNQETNRLSVDAIISQRALREIYLRGFEIAVKDAQPWSVMSSYNRLNGSYTSANQELLTTILRDEWGFKGFVMTDWFGGYESLKVIFEEGNSVSDVVAQMQAGNDLLMPGTPNQTQALIDAVKSGKLDEKILDKNLKNILKMVLQTPRFKEYRYSNKPKLKTNAEISRQVATEGMVLLKNKQKVLPLNSDAKIGLFGNGQIETIKGGTGSGDVNTAYTISIAKGLDENFELDQDLLARYATYVSTLRGLKEYQKPPHSFFEQKPQIPEKPLRDNEISAVVEKTDIGVIVIVRNSGEGGDRKNEKGDFLLTDEEQKMIERVSNAYHKVGKQVVVVLNIGGVIEVASWRDKVDGILLSWQPGQEAGYAIADVLSGRANPSGKLATTFPMDYGDVPSAANFPGDDPVDPSKVVYEEGIYVGYRYYDKFDIKPAYEFGYGLSYTSFEYSNLKLNSNIFKDKIRVTVDITNTGKVAGKEVVELYLNAPANKLDKPIQELKGFAKTKLLQPAETQTISFEIDARTLASFDENKSAWLAEAGKYELRVGASSRDIRRRAFFKLKKDLIVEEVNDLLEPTN